MRRTTIYPSRAVHLAAIGLASCLVAAPLSAQEPQPQPAAPQGVTATPPATHVVVEGETLWGLAQQFLGDPLLWPEIYRLNTAVVEDPHWIYPGEQLRLAPGGAQAVAAQPAGPTGAEPAAAPGAIAVAPSAEPSAAAQQAAAPTGFEGPTIFSASQRKAAQAAASAQRRSQQVYRSVRQGEHFSAGFIADEYMLNRGRVLGNMQTSSLSRLSTTTGAMLYSDVAVEPPPGDTVRVGDTLMTYDVPQYIEGYGSVIRPTGLLRVTSVGAPGEIATAQVIAVYQPIQSGQGVLRAEPFESEPGVHAQPVDSGVVAEVIGLRGAHEVAVLQDVAFINRGSEDGVHPGDIFQVTDVGSASGVGAVEQDEGKILIVGAQPHTASGVIIQLDRPDLRAGATARQIMRMK
jgi:LysM repeat protein